MSSPSEEKTPFPLNRRRLFGIAFVVIVFALLWYFRWPDKDDATWRTMLFQGETMGTTYNIKVATLQNAPDAPKIMSEKIEAVLKEANRALSNYDQEGDLGKFNTFQGTTPFKVSKLTLEVISRSLKISEQTGGAFDVTVGPLVRLWGFHDRSRRDALPDPAILSDMLKNIGYRKLKVHPEVPAVSKEIPKLDVDLSAIAKGKGVDMVAQALDQMGYTDYMVEIGGEVRLRGRNDSRRLWRIGIERPKDDGREIARVIELSDMSVATSGDYRSFYTLDGRRLSHTIDPVTGEPINHGLASVTVLADDCMTADGLATGLTVLGLEKGRKLALKYQIAAFFIARGGKNGSIEVATPEFNRRLGIKAPE